MSKSEDSLLLNRFIGSSRDPCDNSLKPSPQPAPICFGLLSGASIRLNINQQNLDRRNKPHRSAGPVHIQKKSGFPTRLTLITFLCNKNATFYCINRLFAWANTKATIKLIDLIYIKNKKRKIMLDLPRA